MKITANLFLAASVFCLAACSENNSTTNTETAKLEDIATPASPDLAPVTSSTDPAVPAPALPSGPVNPASSGAKMNPPHGEPGHDCAVPVGAPLTGASAGTSTPPANFPKADVSVQSAPTLPSNTQVAAGMNPPHGQPGHDCAVPVGAPLKK
ncbi:MAG TPA: hypothetical protein VK927_00150 [Adhaeribacter sp.]|nr:hypothetical protein [Adhaeribacter sp.]